MMTSLKLLKVAEVARIFNVGVSTVYSWADRGVLKPIYLPRTCDSTATKRNWKSTRFATAEVGRLCENLGVEGSWKEIS